MQELEKLPKPKQIEFCENEIENIKKLLCNPTINNLYSSDKPKHDLITAWAEYLEKLTLLGERKKPINTISTEITQELRELKFVKAVEYVRKTLPFKYKDHTRVGNEDNKLDGNDYRQNSSKKKNYEKENAELIEEYLRTIESLQKFVIMLKSSSFVSELQEKEFEEFLHLHKTARERMNDILDGREKVFVSTQHLLFHAFSKSTLDHAFSMYVRFVKDFADGLSPKQTLKILRGRIQKMQLIYEPKNRLEAFNSGFYGVPCEKCGNFRVILAYKEENKRDELKCFACGHWFYPITLKLVKSELQREK